MQKIVIRFNYLNAKHKNSKLKLLHKYEKMSDGTLGKQMISKQATWNQTKEHQKDLQSISRETLLVYPKLSKLFVIHMEAIKVQLGAGTSKDNTPIAFYSRKLNPAQVNHTTTKKELLSIVETLKNFRNNILSQQIKAYTDHSKLKYKYFNTERLMR